MSNLVKRAYAAGAQQALIDAGLTKTANIGRFYDDMVDTAEGYIGDADEAFGNPLLQMAGVDPAIASNHPRDLVRRAGRTANLAEHSSNTMDELATLKEQQLLRALKGPLGAESNETAAAEEARLSRAILAAAAKGSRLDGAIERNSIRDRMVAEGGISWDEAIRQSPWVRSGGDRADRLKYLQDKWSARPIPKSDAEFYDLAEIYKDQL